MHSFLRSIGFSDYNNKKTRELVRRIVKHPDEKKFVCTVGDTIKAEYRRLFSESFGIAVCGEYSEESGFEYEYFFPYYTSYHVSTVGRVGLEKHLFSDALSGLCEDYKVGVTIIFYLQNRVDIMKWVPSQSNEIPGCQVSFSGLAADGTILMPVKKSEDDILRSGKVNSKRRRLIAQAMDGNEDAMEELTAGDLEKNSRLMDQVRETDIYTLVDTCFMPCGADCEMYSVLGEITEVRTLINNLTKEEIYIINILCNDLYIEICVNKKDVYGEPSPGRRFKGDIWLQGAATPV